MGPSVVVRNLKRNVSFFFRYTAPAPAPVRYWGSMYTALLDVLTHLYRRFCEPVGCSHHSVTHILNNKCVLLIEHKLKRMIFLSLAFFSKQIEQPRNRSHRGSVLLLNNEHNSFHNRFVLWFRWIWALRWIALTCFLQLQQLLKHNRKQIRQWIFLPKKISFYFSKLAFARHANV